METKGTPGFDDEGGIQIDGMVCAWWFDGSVMHDEIIAKVCDMIVLPSIIHHGQERKVRVVERSCRYWGTIVQWVCIQIEQNSGSI